MLFDMKNLLVILIGIICLCASSCGGHKVITVDVPKVSKEYVYKTDTLIKEDSIYIFNDRFIKNDTIFITKFQDRFKYVYKNRVDTLIKVDTITIVNTEQIKSLSDENEELKNVNYFYCKIGMMMLIIIGFMALYNFIKRI